MDFSSSSIWDAITLDETNKNVTRSPSLPETANFSPSNATTKDKLPSEGESTLREPSFVVFVARKTESVGQMSSQDDLEVEVWPTSAPQAPQYYQRGSWLIASSHFASGTFSTIHDAFSLSMNSGIAVCKSTSFSSMNGTRLLRHQLYALREAATLLSASHPNIVELYDVQLNGDRWNLYEEKVDGVELFDWLSCEGRKGVLSEDQARIVSVQVLNALKVSTLEKRRY